MAVRETPGHVDFVKEGALVTVRLTTASGRTLSGSAFSNGSGNAVFTYKVKAGRDGRDTYELTAEACIDGNCADGTGSFVVN